MFTTFTPRFIALSPQPPSTALLLRACQSLWPLTSVCRFTPDSISAHNFEFCSAFQPHVPHQQPRSQTPTPSRLVSAICQNILRSGYQRQPSIEISPRLFLQISIATPFSSTTRNASSSSSSSTGASPSSGAATLRQPSRNAIRGDAMAEVATAGSSGWDGSVRGDSATDAGYRQSRRAAAREGKPVMPQRGQFVDWAQLRVRGGRGGPGRVAFEPVGRGRHLAAAGGSGGGGGDVIIRANNSTTSLYGILPVLVGGAGGAGGAGGRTGARGADRVLDVPVGTMVRIWQASAAGESSKIGDGLEDVEDRGDADADYGHAADHDAGAPPHAGAKEDSEADDYSEDEGEQLGEEDRSGHVMEERPPLPPHGAASLRFTSPPILETELAQPGQVLVIARGGSGGRGNQAFPSLAGRPAPSECELGTPGQEFWVRLETRLLADVGFVGLPNAGKSTLLSAITAARAKVGSYAFTTIRPQLGTILYGDGSRLVTADIPGLVQRAVLNKTFPSHWRGGGSKPPLGTFSSLSFSPSSPYLKDEPGLTPRKGAHANRGRGNAFLRHIERCRCMAFVLDLSGGQGQSTAGQAAGIHQAHTGDGASGNAAAGWDIAQASRPRQTRSHTADSDGNSGGAAAHGNDDDGGEAAAKAFIGVVPLPPAEQLRVLQEELRMYNPELLAAPALVVANKLDRCSDPRVALRDLMAATPLPIVPVSAAHGVGLTRLMDALRAIARPGTDGTQT
ncbi:hypothetical protein Vretimale_17116 [Volvox reticuliferus]|uniref:Uncharacterized protein n=1 Tax=Volvox reticuliferus TaxID=1737510 RepID=A0A8J4GSI4_9CHLO|nr:hypothetical protein Vretimale_17116 [Volvox reticuliferus]